MVTHYVFVAALNYSAERQILRIRKMFLAAVLRQDIAWYSYCTLLFRTVLYSVLSRFDTTTTADFATRMTEDLNKMQDGMGEKLGMLLRSATVFCFTMLYSAFQIYLCWADRLHLPVHSELAADARSASLSPAVTQPAGRQSPMSVVGTTAAQLRVGHSTRMILLSLRAKSFNIHHVFLMRYI